MKKFFLMTRGRTGSTAVIDELNKSEGVCTTQELFIDADFASIPPEKFKRVYNLLLPFALWKKSNFVWKLAPSFWKSDEIWAGTYLTVAERLARKRGASTFGFKVLSHHLGEKTFLSPLLKKRGYKVIYLTRNIARQVLSGMIAAQRGFYNTTEKFEDERRYQIDVEKFKGLVKWGMKSVENDINFLRREGFEFIEVSYEDFQSNRNMFYDKIFSFLEVPVFLPPGSDWTILIKDLHYTIENYEEVDDCATALGVSLDG